MDTAQSKHEYRNAPIRAWRASGLSLTAYCNLHGLKLAYLAYCNAKPTKDSP